jgi:type IV pilus assembly protein PilA
MGGITMNNKGVTLIELLIVIVVLGIISAFAIPAVGTIITNTEKDAIVADAIAIENAAKLYCAQTTCTASQTLEYSDLDPYVQSFNDAYYVTTAGTVLATKQANGDWSVTLEGAGDNTGTDDWEWPAGIPSALDRTHVADDTD